MNKIEYDLVADSDISLATLKECIEKSRTISAILKEDYLENEDSKEKTLLCNYQCVRNLCRIVDDYLWEMCKTTKKLIENSEKLIDMHGKK